MSKQPHKEAGHVSVFVRDRAASSEKGETESVNQALERSGHVHAATECSKCVSLRKFNLGIPAAGFSFLFLFPWGRTFSSGQRAGLQARGCNFPPIKVATLAQKSFLKSYQRSKTRLR